MLDRILSPREMRERLDRQRANMQQAVAAAGAEMLAQERARTAKRINRYSDALPPDVRALFNTLSFEDQRRVAFYCVDTRSCVQKDYDDTDSHRGWPEV